MKRTLTLIAFLLIFTLSWAQKKTATKDTGFYLEYVSSTKTIIITGTTITTQEWIEQFDNPMSSIPSSRKEVLKKSAITPAKLSELKSFLRTTGFMTLPKNEYGGNSADRYYPYTLTLRMNGKQKKVLYRSNPAPETEQAPKAFSDVEKKVNELVDEGK